MAYEYYFEVNTDDDKGVPFGPVNKDNLDIVRLIIDFTCWLDANESVTEISYLTIKANPALPLPSWQANYPLDETSTTPPVDTYPLVFVEQSVMHEGKAVVLDLAAGTPQLSYAVSFTAVAGLSRRRRLVDILMVIDKPLNSALVADGPPVPVYTYPLVINTTTILPSGLSGRVYIANNTAAPITVTLPSSPVMGQVISFLDIIGNLDDDNVTFVGAPGSSIFEGGHSYTGSQESPPPFLDHGVMVTTVVSNSGREDIRFEWTGTFWEVNRRYVYEDLNVIDTLRVRGPWAPPTDSDAIHIGPWVDTSATGLHSSLFVQHWFDAPSNSTGGVASPMAQQVNIMGTPNYYVWGFNMEMDIRTTNTVDPTMQHVNYASTIRRHPPGRDVAFAYYGMIEDMSGQAISSDVGFELDIRCNGPDATDASKFNSVFGSRALMTFNGQVQYQHPGWQANHTYAANDVITNGVSTTPEHTYVARTAGISGATKPAFPTSVGSVTDGTVIWDYGTTYRAQISRAISINTEDYVAFGCALELRGHYYNAVIDMSYAIMDQVTNPNAAGIRLRPNMTIDFSADQTLAGQSKHVLYWNNAELELAYQGPGTGILFGIKDSGAITIIPPVVNVANDAAAASAGVPYGGLYRNGSVLMVRTV